MTWAVTKGSAWETGHHLTTGHPQPGRLTSPPHGSHGSHGPILSLTLCLYLCSLSFPPEDRVYCLFFASSTACNMPKTEVTLSTCWISLVQFSHSVMSDSLRPHCLQHTMPPHPSPTPGVYSNSCPLSWWCHLTVSSSVVPFFSHLQSFPASGSFQMSQFFVSSDQRHAG